MIRLLLFLFLILLVNGAAAFGLYAIEARYSNGPKGNRHGNVTLYYPEAVPKHFRNVRFDWSSATPGCLKLYPESGDIWFCGTWEAR